LTTAYALPPHISHGRKENPSNSCLTGDETLPHFGGEIGGEVSLTTSAPLKYDGVENDPSPALLRRAPSPLGEGCDFDFSPSPMGRGGTAKRGVRGFFAVDPYKAVEFFRLPRV
jgi:hypothetical protein